MVDALVARACGGSPEASRISAILREQFVLEPQDVLDLTDFQFAAMKVPAGLANRLRRLCRGQGAQLASDADLRSLTTSLAKLRHGPIPSDYRNKEPVVLVSCGSFSPPTMMHLRLLEDARAQIEAAGTYVAGGFLSPVHLAYGKKSLCAMYHRINMVSGALQDSDWLECDPWECQQSEWTRTKVVLEHLTQALAGVQVAGASAPIRVLMVCGGDLLESFPVINADGSPLWAAEDQEGILACGLACMQREGTDLEALINGNALMTTYKKNIHIFSSKVQNNVSSSLIRAELKENRSVKYLCHEHVTNYIREHKLNELPNWRT